MHPVFAPWNGTVNCSADTDCALPGIHASVTLCQRFEIEADGLTGTFCSCSKQLHLQGMNCATANPDTMWDGVIQTSIAVFQMFFLAWMISFFLRMREFKLDPINITFGINFIATVALVSHSLCRGLTIMNGVSSDILIILNRFGAGVALASFASALIVMVLSWQGVLNAGASRKKSLFSKTTRRVITGFACTNAVLLVFLFSTGNPNLGLMIATLEILLTIIWYNLVGRRLVGAFDSSGSGKTNTLHEAVQRISKLISRVTCTSLLGIGFSVFSLVAEKSLIVKHYDSPAIGVVPVHFLNLSFCAAFISIAAFVASVRRAKNRKSTTVHNNTTVHTEQKVAPA